MNLLVFIFWSLFGFIGTPNSKNLDLFEMINSYRVKNKKTALRYSDSLSLVAYIHAVDQFENYSFYDKACSLHSWSKSNRWRGGCIPPEDKNADWTIMWDKPKELVGMNTKGYEISFMYDPKSTPIDPEEVLKGWINSKGHRDCILEMGRTITLYNELKR
jgi:hypothetical protein